jgi:N-acyl-D-aspartate/D-glutamate deacylase
MTWDLVVRGGRVVDGTGAPGFTADVAVRDGRIGKVGRVLEPARRVLDADGLVVAPGFVDVHTHYDAQLHWDPTASCSSWHGVTTVLAGNCGFTLAPARPEDCEWLAKMLSRVEGMSPAALGAGMAWRGGSFGEFWARLDGRLGVNVGGYVGHSALRRFVMGDEASERAARPAEVGAMQELVRAAMREGAAGFSSSQLDIHVAHDGREVPSNHAAPEELIALASVLAEFDRGAIEFIPRSFLEGYDEADRRLMLGMAHASGRPLEVNTLIRMPNAPEGWRRSLEFARDALRQGARIHPMFATNKLGARLSLDTTFLLDEFPTFRDTLVLPAGERERRLRDPAVREALRRETADPAGKAFVPAWAILQVEAVREPDHAGWVGRSIGELAREMGLHPLDCFLELALAEDLTTQFVLDMPPDPAGRSALETLVRDPLVMAGSSDGGAHLLSFVGADYTTRLLTEWVPEVLSLESAISRLTMVPAVVHGLDERGVLREGLAADLVAFDPCRLGVGATRLVRDFPGGSGRYVVEARGYVAIVVNGQVLLENGTHTGALPGRVLRGE